jgi:hypothetical protein
MPETLASLDGHPCPLLMGLGSIPRCGGSEIIGGDIDCSWPPVGLLCGIAEA